MIDQASFCYLHAARVQQDQTGVLASIMTEKHGELRAYLPAASLACLMLGPGTSISHDAMSTLARHGTTVAFTGEQGVRCYGSVAGPSGTSLLTQAVRVVADDEKRLAAARRMYALRFDNDIPDHASLAQLRGYEGARMKAVYSQFAREKRQSFRRSYTTGDFGASDPLNQALSSANACLYGVTAAVLSALGLPHGLGIIHTDSRHALVYDVADIYKPELTIPTAFEVAQQTDPSRAARHHLRKNLRLMKLIPRMVDDIHHVFDMGPRRNRDDARVAKIVNLWNGDDTPIAGGVNHSSERNTNDPRGIEGW